MRRNWILAAVLCAGVARAAEPVKRLYVFGDSYSDTGRGFLDSDGPTAVAVLARQLGLDLVPSNAKSVKGKSLNFAVSGAPTGSAAGRAVQGGWLGLGMKEEVQEFVALVQSGAVTFDPKTTLFFIAGGLNDGRVPTAETIANLEDEMQTLYAAGARRFMVANLTEQIPGFRVTGLRLNPSLLAIPAEMAPKLSGAEIATSHWGSFYDEVLLHPAKYGLTDTTHPCTLGRTSLGQDSNPCAHPETYYFYYPNHPSAATHKAVGDMLYEELTAK